MHDSRDCHSVMCSCKARIACFAILLCLSVTCCAATVVELIADPPIKFLDEEKKAKYIIAADRDGDVALPAAVPGARTVTMTDRKGRKYSCRLPPIEPAAEGRNASANAQVREQQQKQRQRTPQEILDDLASLCFYRAEDWWTYEICYKKAVRQFHREQTADGHTHITVEYSLGMFNSSGRDPNHIRVDASPGQKDLRYVSQQYENGDPCDITGGHRSTEVRYTCGEGSKDLIVSVKEGPTCHYVMTVRTPRICEHQKFRVETPPVSHILCTATAPQLLADEAQAEAAADATTADTQSEDAASADGSSAGDIQPEGQAQPELTVKQPSTPAAEQPIDVASADSPQPDASSTEGQQVFEEIVNENLQPDEAALQQQNPAETSGQSTSGGHSAAAEPEAGPTGSEQAEAAAADDRTESDSEQRPVNADVVHEEL